MQMQQNRRDWSGKGGRRKNLFLPKKKKFFRFCFFRMVFLLFPFLSLLAFSGLPRVLFRGFFSAHPDVFPLSLLKVSCAEE